MTSYRPKKRLLAEEYIKGVISGDRVVLAMAITVIESSLDSDRVLAKKIVEGLLSFESKSVRIGITGVPGVGKSTFIESFGKYLISLGHKVAVLTIDPSSKLSKGSILGDKTRMEKLSTLDDAFIRPSASGVAIGGLTNKTSETIMLCEAAGYDVVLVETVGVGQSEVSVKDVTDFFLLLMLAGAGDDIQGMKKGVMEMADMIVINKADGENTKVCEIAKTQYQNVLQFLPKPDSGWSPTVNTVSSLKNIGISKVWNHIEKYLSLVNENGYFNKNRSNQQVKLLSEKIEDGIRQIMLNSEKIKTLIEESKQKVYSFELSASQAADNILDELRKGLS